MSNIETREISLSDIEKLALSVFTKHGCSADNAAALARTVVRAERDGSLSHGLFRVPGYIASLNSGKVKGDALPKIQQSLPCVITVDGDHGYAPLALETGLPVLAKAASEAGIAVMRVINSFHFAAMWPETEYLAEQGLAGLACTAFQAIGCPCRYKPGLFWHKPDFICLAAPGPYADCV